jgi:hypothetical protein
MSADGVAVGDSESAEGLTAGLGDDEGESDGVSDAVAEDWSDSDGVPDGDCLPRATSFVAVPDRSGVEVAEVGTDAVRVGVAVSGTVIVADASEVRVAVMTVETEGVGVGDGEPADGVQLSETARVGVTDGVDVNVEVGVLVTEPVSVEVWDTDGDDDPVAEYDDVGEFDGDTVSLSSAVHVAVALAVRDNGIVGVSDSVPVRDAVSVKVGETVREWERVKVCVLVGGAMRYCTVIVEYVAEPLTCVVDREML